MATTTITRTPAATTAVDAWTLSVWLKRSATGVTHDICSGRANTDGGNNQSTYAINDDDNLYFDVYSGGSIVVKFITDREFRDVGAWYHIVLDFDSSTAGARSAADRMKVWINGVRETSFSTETQSGADEETHFCQQDDCPLVFGGNAGGSRTPTFNGEMSHINYVAGVGHPASVFGETDATSGIWKIKTSPSVTYGTNGFNLKMEDRTNLDLDSSPNAYTFTTAGTLTATYDNPSNNFCTMNPLDNYELGGTFTNGNTTVETRSPDPSYGYATGTLGGAGGKWYWEMKLEQAVTATNYIATGIAGRAADSEDGLGYKPDAICYQAYDGKIRDDNVLTTYGNTWTTGDIIGVAMDLDNSKLYFSINGTWQNSGVPTSGATGTGAHSMSTDVADTLLQAYLPAFGDHAGASYSTGIGNYNFGNGYFKTTAVSSANADDAGIGAMEYDVPAGYYCLCTKNIKAYGG